MTRRDIYLNWTYTCIVGVVLFFWMAQLGYLLAWIGFCGFKAYSNASKVESEVHKKNRIHHEVIDYLKTTKCEPWLESDFRVNRKLPPMNDQLTRKQYQTMDAYRLSNLQDTFELNESNLDNLNRFFDAKNLSETELDNLRKYAIIPNRFTDEEKDLALYSNWRDREYFCLGEVVTGISPTRNDCTAEELKKCRSDVGLFYETLVYLNRAFKLVNGYDLY